MQVINNNITYNNKINIFTNNINVSFMGRKYLLADRLASSVHTAIPKEIFETYPKSSPKEQQKIITMITSVIVSSAITLSEIIFHNKKSNNIEETINTPTIIENDDILNKNSTEDINKIELELKEEIEKIDIPEKKRSIIQIFNNICPNNSNGTFTINGITIPNIEIVKALLVKLKKTTNQTSNTENTTVIPRLYNTNNIDIDSLFSNRFPILKKSYDEILNNNSTNTQINKELIQQLVQDILNSSATDENIDLILKSIEEFYSKNLIDIALINRNIGNNNSEKQKLYNDIVNKTITEASINDWKLHYSVFPISFQNFNILHNIGLPNENNYTQICNMLNENKIKDFELTYKDEKRIEMLVSINNSELAEQLEILTKFYDLIKPLDKRSRQKNSINEIYAEISNNEKTYPHIIKFLSSGKNPERNMKILNNILISENIFPTFFTIHSKCRFLERFILNHKRSKDIEKYTQRKIEKIMIELQKEMSSGIQCSTYLTYNNNKGVNIKFYSETFKRNVICGIDKDAHIHTIYY